MKLFGREPALILAGIAGVIQFLSAVALPLTTGQQGALNAVAVAVIGVVTAYKVAAERALPLVAGGVQALLALGLAFNLHLTADAQAGVMALVTAAVAMFVRQNVVAPVPAPVVVDEAPRPVSRDQTPLDGDTPDASAGSIYDTGQ
jgi:hypothetical protein